MARGWAVEGIQMLPVIPVALLHIFDPNMLRSLEWHSGSLQNAGAGMISVESSAPP